MPRGILTFRLPEEDDEFRVAQDGWKWREAVHDLGETLRGWEKHGAVPEGVESEDPAPGLRALLYRILDEAGLEL